MSPRRPDPELAERRRETLIRAGYAEILENGIAGTTIDAVVSRAGLSKGGALYYFRTKDDLLYAVLAWLLAQLDRTLEQVTAAQPSPRARLASELEVLFHSAEVNRKFYAVFFDFVALSVRDERFRLLLAAFLDKCHRRDMAIIEEGIRQQQFRRVKPENAARTIRGLVDGYCLQWMMASPAVDLENFQDICRAVLGSHLLR